MTMISGQFVYVNPNEDPHQKVEYPFFGERISQKTIDGAIFSLIV